MEEKVPAKITETEEKTAVSQETEKKAAISQETEKKTAISQEPEKTQTISQEIAETEEMKIIADEKAEIADDQKTEKKEVNSEKTEEKTISPEDAAKLAEKRKMIAKGKSPMEETRLDKVAKMEDNQETEKNQTAEMEVICEEAEEMELSPEEAAKIAKRKMIAKGKSQMAEEEEQLTEVNVEYCDDDFDDFEDLYEEFLADLNSESDSDELNTAISWSLAEIFFQKIGASTVYWYFRKALESRNIEVDSRDELEPHRPFAGILMIFGVHYHKKEKGKEVVLTILREFMIGDGLKKCDVIGFVNKYDIGETHEAALQRAMFLVMCIFEEAGKVNEPAKLVAEAMLDAYDTGIWGDEVFGTIYRFLRSPYKTLVVVGLVLVTSLALFCKDRNSPELSKVIHQNKFVEVVHKMDTAKLEEEVVMRVTACVDALGWSLAEDFFQKIGASTVYWNFRKALDSGNIEALSHDELEPHRPFAGILMIFGVHYHKIIEGLTKIKAPKLLLIEANADCSDGDFPQGHQRDEISTTMINGGAFNWEFLGIFGKLEKQDYLLCWCFSICDYLEAIYYQLWYGKIKCSKQELIDKVKPYASVDTTYSFNAYQALKWIEKYGLSLEGNCPPYKGVKGVPFQRLEKPILRVSGVQKLPNDEQIILERLEKHPVICSIKVNPTDVKRSVQTGKPYALCEYRLQRSHAIVLSGWSNKPSACYLIRDPKKRLTKVKRGTFGRGEINPMNYCCCVNNVFIENVK